MSDNLTTISIKTYYQFFHRYLGNRLWLAVAGSFVAAVLDGVGLSLFLPLLSVVNEGDGARVPGFSRLFGWFGESGVAGNLTTILLLMGGFFLAKGLVSYAATAYRVRLQVRFTRRLRKYNLGLLANYDYAAFADSDAGQLQNLFGGETDRSSFALRAFMLTLQGLAMAAVYFLLAGWVNPAFTVLALVGGGAAQLIFGRLYGRTKAASAAVTEEMNGFQGFLLQAVSGFKYLKATGGMDRYRKKIESSIDRLEAQALRVGRMDALSGALREPILIGVVIGAILVQTVWLGAPLAPLLLTLLLFWRGLGALVGVQHTYNNFLGYSGAIAEMRTAEARLLERPEPVGTIPYPGLEAGIRLGDLHFSYGALPVLSGISLTVAPRTTLGIVGASGVGKTTLVNLLCGLLRPAPGQLTIGGVDATELDVREYRNHLGYVTQETPLFSDSIFNNVSGWAERTPTEEDRVRHALEMARASDFTADLDTPVGFGGIRLSGGQRQRLAIARSLYRRVDLLILDEATASLDGANEASIRENIDRLAGRYTMVVIAHRLATVRTADQILYLHADGTYELGTFAELRRASAGFRGLTDQQSII